MSGDPDPRDDWGPEEWLTGNYAMVRDSYESLPDIIQKHFHLSIPIIVVDYDNKYGLDVLIPYLFMKVEQAQRMTLYAALVKKYKIDKDLASTALDDLYMTRKKFLELYETLAGNPIKTETIEFAKEAEEFRDNILHGKTVEEEDKAYAACAIFRYSILFNEQVNKDFGFQPFGSMRGFKGNAQSHDKTTSKWMLMGMKLL
ncbi:MAG: hypothetical protein K8953_03965 [Proteobacteria bacterium]|nr:hypothetical protein [Pseudomonadota bacterium]